MGILLFLVSCNYSIGVGCGYYMPSLERLNLKYNAESRIKPSLIVGLDGKISSSHFFLNVGVDYFKGKTLDELRNLAVIPIDVSLNYKSWLIPALLDYYAGVGYERCFAQYTGENNIKTSGWGNGIPVKVGVNFMVIPEVSVDLLGGFRFVNISEIKSSDGSLLTDATCKVIPIELWGPFFKINIIHKL